MVPEPGFSRQPLPGMFVGIASHVGFGADDGPHNLMDMAARTEHKCLPSGGHITGVRSQKGLRLGDLNLDAASLFSTNIRHSRCRETAVVLRWTFLRITVTQRYLRQKAKTPSRWSQ